MASPMHPAKPLATGIRIVGAQRESLATELALRYAAGESIRSLADSTGRSYGFVQSLLKETGVEFRARGGATRGAAARAAQQARREAAASVPRIATGLAVGGQPAVADADATAKARKRAAKAVKRTPDLPASRILTEDAGKKGRAKKAKAEKADKNPDGNKDGNKDDKKKDKPKKKAKK